MQEQLRIITDRLITEIRAEMQLISEFSNHIQQIKTNIKQKNWGTLEENLNVLNQTATKVENLEQIRHQSFSAIKQLLGLPAEATIRRILPELSYTQCNELEELHTQLKIKVLKVKIEYQNLGYYLRNISDFIYRFLEEVFPHTKGKIYSRLGKATAKTPESVMINREL